MRIGISCNRFGAGGGLERYARDLAAGMRTLAGVRVDVFARDFAPGLAEELGVQAHRIDVSWLPGKLRDEAFSWALQKRRAACDVLIGCNRVRHADIAICGGTHRGYLAARGREPGIFDRLQIRLESDQYAGAERVIAHSRRMQSELQELYGVPEERIALLYPPADVRRFSPVDPGERQALRERYGFGDEVVFLFPSSGHARKGFDLLARAFERSKLPILLAVAGRPTGSKRMRVREFGYVEDIESLYRAADFTTLASDYEPFGMVGVESVLCGTPLLFADNIACLEVVRPAAVEAFSRASAESLDSALSRAVSRVREGRARLVAPAELLAYDPAVSVHVRALAELCSTVAAHRAVSTP